MIILLDKNVDANISSITCDTIDSQQFYWNIASDISFTIDTSTNKIRIGAIDVTITFNSSEAMKPYLDQFKSFNTIRNPFTDGVDTDPFYDLPKTGSIVSHTYVDTDIEKDLIQGN